MQLPKPSFGHYLNGTVGGASQRVTSSGFIDALIIQKKEKEERNPGLYGALSCCCPGTPGL